MKKVVLYWNHICILLNEEKKFLNRVKEKLAKSDIDLEIHYFGLGSKEHMGEYIAKKESLLPDIMVSADLEVFEDKYIFSKLGELYECEDWIKLKETAIVQSVRRKKTLLPFLAIPLVCYTNDEKCKEEKSLPDLLKTEGFAFGGINNSAGKTIAKLSLQEYGYEFTEKLLEKSTIIGSETAKLVAKEILCEELSCIYAKNAGMIVCLEYGMPKKTEEHIDKFCVVTQ